MKDGVQAQVIGTPIHKVKRDRRLAAVKGPLMRKPTKMGGDSWYPQVPDVTSINLLGLRVELLPLVVAGPGKMSYVLAIVRRRWNHEV
jgi:hypothetical protein